MIECGHFVLLAFFAIVRVQVLEGEIGPVDELKRSEEKRREDSYGSMLVNFSIHVKQRGRWLLVTESFQWLHEFSVIERNQLLGGFDVDASSNNANNLSQIGAWTAKAGALEVNLKREISIKLFAWN